MSSLKYIVVPIITAILSQFTKLIIESIKYKKINIMRFLDGMGGMPSTHCALVSSLTTIIYLNYSIYSPLFSIVVIFSLITIYDSMGIRYESGNQAKVINKIANSKLKERLGHKPIESLIGVIFGIIFAIILNKII